MTNQLFVIYWNGKKCPICLGRLEMRDYPDYGCAECSARFTYQDKDMGDETVTIQLEEFEDEVAMIERIQFLAGRYT